jgi:hypothetical protein
LVLRQNVRPDEAVVASGFLYLEAAHQLGTQRVRAWPAEQGRHPGWRSRRPPDEPVPEGTFVWAGERAAPELALIRRTRRARTLFANSRAVILRVE